MGGTTLFFFFPLAICVAFFLSGVDGNPYTYRPKSSLQTDVNIPPMAGNPERDLQIIQEPKPIETIPERTIGKTRKPNPLRGSGSTTRWEDIFTKKSKETKRTTVYPGKGWRDIEKENPSSDPWYEGRPVPA